MASSSLRTQPWERPPPASGGRFRFTTSPARASSLAPDQKAPGIDWRRRPIGASDNPSSGTGADPAAWRRHVWPPVGRRCRRPPRARLADKRQGRGDQVGEGDCAGGRQRRPSIIRARIIAASAASLALGANAARPRSSSASCQWAAAWLIGGNVEMSSRASPSVAKARPSFSLIGLQKASDQGIRQRSRFATNR
jgi:hypothetical protein